MAFDKGIAEDITPLSHTKREDPRVACTTGTKEHPMSTQ